MFIQALATVVPTLFAQVVLTMRPVFFDNDYSILITAE